RSIWPGLSESLVRTRPTESGSVAGPPWNLRASRLRSSASWPEEPGGRPSPSVTLTSEERIMASWPTAPDADGNGADETDLRRIIGAQYMNKGVLPNGGLTVEGTSSMNYRVNSGAAFMWTSESSRLGVLVPCETLTIPTEAAPSTGSRTDSVYLSLDGIPRVTSGAVPSSAVLLGSFIVSAGATSTISSQKTIDRDYAIGTGQSLGRLAHWDIPGGTWGGVL